MITKISDGTVITNGKKEKKNVYINENRIFAVTNEELPFDKLIDARDKYVSSGFIDIHTHGAGGSDFLDNTEEDFINAAVMHAKHGATTIIPTITSSTKESMLDAVKIFNKVKNKKYNGAIMYGLHMEGPYFSKEQKGAQDERFIRGFDKNEYEEVLNGGGIVRWTAAPELAGSKNFAECLIRNGVLPCMGHSNAEYDQARKAFNDGFTHVTHLYSCTSTVHRRNAYRYAGIIEEAYLENDMTVEIIADGKHLPKALLQLVYKIKGRDKTALITDSMRGAGTQECKSILGGKKDGLNVIIEDGIAKLPDRSAFAGSVATCDTLVHTMISMAEIPLEESVPMATATPARILGIKNKGDILPGYDADIIVFDKDIKIIKTIINGEIVYSI